METMAQDEKKNESKSRMDAMTQNGNESERKSNLDILIEELDAMFIRNGWELPVWEDPEPNHHRVIIRFQGKKKD